ncbi:MAG: hypothetical protein ACP5PJ_06390, partial [Acidimicrobiales bacterium]
GLGLTRSSVPRLRGGDPVLFGDSAGQAACSPPARGNRYVASQSSAGRSSPGANVLFTVSF